MNVKCQPLTDDAETEEENNKINFTKQKKSTFDKFWSNRRPSFKVSIARTKTLRDGRHQENEHFQYFCYPGSQQFKFYSQ